MNIAKKIIAIIVTILILVYIVYAICLLLFNPTDIYILTQGTLSEEDDTTGYIIRKEQVIEDENHENGIYAIIPEGQRVAVNEYIFRYYSDDEKGINEQIKQLNYQIQDKLEGEKTIPSSADIKVIENQIEEKIENINMLNNYQEILEYKNNIDNLISKKINYIGEVTENNEIKQLIEQRKQLVKQLTNGSEYKSAPISGVVSYRVDGLEQTLTEENLSQINSELLDSLELKAGQIIPTSNEYGKVIDNFKCYIAVPINTELALQAKVGDTVILKTPSNDEFDAKIIQINEESGTRIIIFQIDKMTEELINHRKISIEIVWWNESGYKVPNQALIEENGLYYIMRNKSGIQSKLLVKIEKQNENFSIISSYTTKELQELGFNESEIRNYKKISNYDEIILKSKTLKHRV